jgi:hypothetical protein
MNLHADLLALSPTIKEECGVVAGTFRGKLCIEVAAAVEGWPSTELTSFRSDNWVDLCHTKMTRGGRAAAREEANERKERRCD